MNCDFSDESACQLCGKCPQAAPGLQHYTGVDPCLGLLDDVVQACCGHGGVGEPYVVVAPGNAPGTMMPRLDGPHVALRGQAALDYFRGLGVGPPCSDTIAMDNPITQLKEAS